MSPPIPPPRGPWSDLPPEPEPRRNATARWRSLRHGPREPFINNWKGLLIVAFLLFAAPLLASWLGHLIMSYVAAR